LGVDKTSGGETLIWHEDDYFETRRRRPCASTDFFEAIARRFNRLLVLADRMPHAVHSVKGNMEPLEGRIVVHGHIGRPALLFRPLSRDTGVEVGCEGRPAVYAGPAISAFSVQAGRAAYPEARSTRRDRRSAVQVIGSQFSKLGDYGDFGWMIPQPAYDDALFIFNDNQEQFLAYLEDLTPDTYGCQKGGGNAGIRPYRCQVPPRAAGVPTGVIETMSGYSKLTPAVKNIIDAALGIIRGTLASGHYERVFFSADDKGELGTGTFRVGDDVKSYIVAELRKLAD
jgi:hypothetical protein